MSLQHFISFLRWQCLHNIFTYSSFESSKPLQMITYQINYITARLSIDFITIQKKIQSKLETFDEWNSDKVRGTLASRRYLSLLPSPKFHQQHSWSLHGSVQGSHYLEWYESTTGFSRNHQRASTTGELIFFFFHLGRGWVVERRASFKDNCLLPG